MTSIFDQYEQASLRSKQNIPPSIKPEISSTGLIQMKLTDDGPIFTKQKVNFMPSDRILYLSVSNNFIVIAMANNILLRIDMKHPDKPEEINISKYIGNLRLSGLYLDPLGQHLLVSTKTKQGDTSLPELFYLHRKTTKLKQAAKCRGHEITAVAWNFSNTSETNSGPILLGTSRGLIFETEIGLEGEKIFATNLEQYWRQLPNYLPLYGSKEVEGLIFDIGKDSKPPITGLEFHKIPNTDKYFIIVTTLIRIYQYIGSVANPDEKPLLQQVFSKYLNTKESFNQLESSLGYSRMQFFYPAPRVVPKSFGWLTESGILYAQVDPWSDPENVLMNQQLLPCPEANLLSGNSAQLPPKAPLSFVLTEFHALLLYVDHVKGISILNQELIFEDMYNDAFGKLINITRDPITGSIWAYSERAVFKYKVTKEDRNVWQVYVEKGEFELAKIYCKDNPIHRDQVLVKKAEMLFKNKKYEESALIYAETYSSFEEISLKFLQERETKALKSFLEAKLKSLKSQDKTQTTMIVVWVVELFMNEMGVLRSDQNFQQHKSQYEELQKQFENFLKIPKVEECIRKNRSTICNLMASHGDKDNLINLTVMHRNYEEVIRQHLYKNNYLEALEVLKKQGNKELFYQFAGTLLQELPKPTVQALISQGSNLQSSKLLPALVSCNSDEKHAQQIIMYLESCIYNQSCEEQAIHNFLLSLYARYKKSEVMRYISSQGQDVSMVHYDVHYALRLCQEAGLTEACVQLSALLGLWTTAVDLALTISVDLAKQIAGVPLHHDDVELRKKLWLKIAEHVVRERDDIKEAMKFLQQCDLVRIEDILPFFSDFVTIDHFKEAICNSLQEYNQHIQDLKEEMEEATKSAEIIRKDIQGFRTRCTFVHAKDMCNTCDGQLLMRPFYVFPCGHRFHSDCLVAALTPLLSIEQQTKLADLQKQLISVSGKSDETVSTDGSASLSTKDQIKADIDDLIASECLYCGDLMIESIDKPFIEEEDYERVMKEWA
ncbi:vacuolar protein sorting-associated protein 18 homolog isoform X1 [Leptopilina heterotoma]|uniref:vacuolar protein sorting-associated protein 18 homolog isoform X1 n=1 Tax=Leptopilina heterotoma TaxID=63436 RepID=UPI001CA8D727|nr:vacuolar protein sorting-associated protein 18 homolog isoform X1 [Leptopilina heterotoma]